MDNGNLTQYFKSIVDQDRCAVVICNTAHEIIYMNPAAAERYAKRGGAALVGQSLLNCHNAQSVEQIGKALDKLGVEARRVQHSGVRKRLRLLPKRIFRESALDGRAAAQ